MAKNRQSKAKESAPRRTALPAIVQEDTGSDLTPGGRRLAALGQFERLWALYKVQDNPIYAFAAYDVARSFGVEIPDWVFGYFDHVANHIREAAARRPGKDEIAPALVRAFGFKPGGVELKHKQSMFEKGFLPEAPFRQRDGTFNPFDRERDRDLQISDFVRIETYVRTRRPAHTAQISKAEERGIVAQIKLDAAKQFKLEVSTIRRAVRAYRASPSPIRSIDNDIKLCTDDGMTRDEAIKAVASAWGRDESDIKRNLRNPPRRR